MEILFNTEFRTAINTYEELLQILCKSKQKIIKVSVNKGLQPWDMQE